MIFSRFYVHSNIIQGKVQDINRSVHNIHPELQCLTRSWWTEISHDVAECYKKAIFVNMEYQAMSGWVYVTAILNSKFFELIVVRKLMKKSLLL